MVAVSMITFYNFAHFILTKSSSIKHSMMLSTITGSEYQRNVIQHQKSVTLNMSNHIDEEKSSNPIRILLNNNDSIYD